MMSRVLSKGRAGSPEPAESDGQGYHRLSNEIRGNVSQKERSFTSRGELVFEQNMLLHRLGHGRFELLFLHRFDQILHDALLEQLRSAFNVWMPGQNDNRD